MMTVTSGRKCSALSKSSSPLGLLVKMLLATSRWGSTKCYLTWKPRATKDSRLLFRLVPSTPTTAETEYGLLPTPVTNEGGRNKSASPGAKIRPSLGMMAKRNMWPTPVASNAKHGVNQPDGKRGATLVDAVKRPDLWPTPLARDSKSGAGSPEWRAKRAAEKKEERPLNEVISGQLNPEWVEWLMGYPAGWTELEPSETPSSPKSSK